MKRIVCTFAGLLLAVAGVQQTKAQEISIQGSDTLFNMTNYLLDHHPQQCGGYFDGDADGYIVYAGGGSSAGAAAMIANSQDVAPMSRALKTSECTGYGETATACAHSLDAMTIYRSGNSFADNDNSCEGNEVNCESTANEDKPSLPIVVQDINGIDGMQCPGCSGGSYTFNDWKDVLALAYGGKHHDGTIDCASDVRYTLVGLPSLPATGGYEGEPLDCQNDCWENLFMAAGGDADCTDEKCNLVWHVWRRGDLSGTTDTFKSLVGIKTFCNGNEYQDNDPIRRPVSPYEDLPGRKDMPMVVSNSATQECTGDEGQNVEVVENVATLGLLVPIVVPPPFDDATGVTAKRTVKPCSKGKFEWKAVPFSTRPLCEDGAPSIFGNCLVPVDTDGNADCINMYDNWAVFTPLDNDTRMTNMVQRNARGSIVVDETGADVMYAYYNIHGDHTISDYVPPCNHDNSTDQIACLSVASPCALGYAGMGAQVNVTDAAVLNVDGVEATEENIISFDYPLTRYLWINSLKGFSNSETNQQDLAGCFCDQTLSEEAAVASGFIPIPGGPIAMDPCQ